MNLPLKPLGDFPHLASANYAQSNLTAEAHIRTLLSIKDFQQGLNPLEPKLLQYLDKTSVSQGANLLSLYCDRVWQTENFRSVKEQKELEEKITEQLVQYMDQGVLKKVHLMHLIERLLYNLPDFATEIIHQTIDKKHLLLTDTTKTNVLTLQNISVPLMFTLKIKNIKTFFERYSIDSLRALTFHVTRAHYNRYLTLPESAQIVKTYDYLSYCQEAKDKKGLALCAQYLNSDKKESDKKAMEVIVGGSTKYYREKFEALKKEVRQQNSELPNYIDHPNLEEVLDATSAGKDLMHYAIDAKHTELIKKMITMEVFQSRKKSINKAQQCHVGYAASKGQVSLEKLLAEHHFYEIENFGVPHADKTTYELPKNERAEQNKYQTNVPQLSDSTVLQLMQEGLCVRAQDLFIHKNLKSYELYLDKNPDLLRSEQWLTMVESCATNWFEKEAVKMFYDNKAYHYFSPSQSHLPLVFHTVCVLERSCVHPDAHNSAATEQAVEKNQRIASKINQKFIESLSLVMHAPTAGLVMNQYLKYFPDKKQNLLNAVSILNNPWALKLDRKNLEADLSTFLSSFGSSDAAPKKLLAARLGRNKI